jgi:hypothetical protein
VSRHLLILANAAIKKKAHGWIDAVPFGTSVEFREARRSTEANAKMWACLSDVSKQVLHMGQRYPAEDWKILFMAALGQEMKFIPALDGMSFVPLGYRSSELSKAEMSELIELILQWGTEHGVIFHDTAQELETADAAH